MIIPLRFFLGMTPSSSTDNAITHVAWMFLYRMTICVKSLGPSTGSKPSSLD